MKRCLSVILLLPLLLLVGCREQLPDYTLELPTTESTTESIATTTEESVTETSAPKEWREYATYPVERPTDNVIGNARYYTDARAVSYYDAEMGRAIYLCSQPNCTHSDSQCLAYLGGHSGSSYIVTGDLVYAIVNRMNEDGSIRFVEKNLITGNTRTLWDMTPEADMVREFFTFSVCGEEAFLTFRQYEMDWLEDGVSYYEKNRRQYSYAIDLATGERELLIESEIPTITGIQIEGSHIIPALCTSEFLVISEINYASQLPMTREDYYKQYPQGDYGKYSRETLKECTTETTYSLNRNTGERKRLFGNAFEAKTGDTGSYRDRKMVFVQEDTVYIYDGYTGEVTEYFTQERIALLMYLDGRIVYNVYPEENGQTEPWDFFWYDITTGERQQFQKGIKIMVFSIHGETSDYFYGIYNGRVNSFISKQDFYNENYDAAF